MRPGIFFSQINGPKGLDQANTLTSEPAIYEVRGSGVKPNAPHRTQIERDYAPCWRAREACDCSARMRSASVPPPPSGGALGAAVLALAGFGAALGGVEGSAATSMASIAEFGPSSWIASFATSAAMSLMRSRC